MDGRDDWDLEAGRKLFAGPCRFLLGVADPAGLPPAGTGEVAFAGRSNVGKSSLVNALTGRKTLARTSNTPGRTQQLNYFALGEPAALLLVDLPGYGYAKTARTKVEAWTALILDYLRGRPTLKRVMLLVDARHGLKANDTEIMTLLDEAAVSYQLVLTKLDKLKPGERGARLTETESQARTHGACHPTVHATSAEKSWGLEALRAEIAAVATI